MVSAGKPAELVLENKTHCENSPYRCMSTPEKFKFLLFLHLSVVLNEAVKRRAVRAAPSHAVSRLTESCATGDEGLATAA